AYEEDEEPRSRSGYEDGWLHTGDICMWLPGGRIQIIDRCFNCYPLFH
ncbi:unnamed protein product, partial [Brassica oleracea var. botrytis]